MLYVERLKLDFFSAGGSSSTWTDFMISNRIVLLLLELDERGGAAGGST